MLVAFRPFCTTLRTNTLFTATCIYKSMFILSKLVSNLFGTLINVQGVFPHFQHVDVSFDYFHFLAVSQPSPGTDVLRLRVMMVHVVHTFQLSYPGIYLLRVLRIQGPSPLLTSRTYDRNVFGCWRHIHTSVREHVHMWVVTEMINAFFYIGQILLRGRKWFINFSSIFHTRQRTVQSHKNEN